RCVRCPSPGCLRTNAPVLPSRWSSLRPAHGDHGLALTVTGNYGWGRGFRGAYRLKERMPHPNEAHVDEQQWPRVWAPASLMLGGAPLMVIGAPLKLYGTERHFDIPTQE